MNLRNIAVVLSANTTSFRSQMAMASRDLERFDKQAGSSSTGLEKLGKVAGTVAKVGLVAVAIAFAAAVSSAVQFETRMRNVNSISHLSEQAFRDQNAAVLAMSKEFPQSANTLAEGLYDIASSGFQAADGLMVLEASAMAASAGMTDTATSAKAITAVLNAYGLEADQANRVGNVLFQGVNVGVMSFEELAGSIGDTVGMAAAAGVEVEDLVAGIATMTLSGISAAEASTSMNRTIQALIQPSDSLAASIQALGYESGTSMLETLGLHGTMEKLRQVTGGNIEVLLRYFPEIRAARGALALMANEGKNYTDVQNDMNDAQDDGGAMLKTFEEQMKGTAAQFTLLKNNATAWGIQLGTVVLPYLQDFGDEVRKASSRLGDLADEGERRLEPFLRNLRPLLENAKVLFSDLAGAVGPVVGAFGALAAVGVIEALNALSTALVATTGFLIDNKEVSAALVTMYTVHIVGAAFAAGGAFDGLALKVMYAHGAMMKTGAVQALQGIQAAAYGVSAAFSTGGITGAAKAAGGSILSLLTPMGLVGIALAGLAATYVIIQKRNAEFRSEAREMVDEWSKGFDPANDSFLDFQKNQSEVATALDRTRKSIKGLQDDAKSGDMDRLNRARSSQKELEQLKEAEKELGKLSDEYVGYGKVVEEVRRKTDLTFADAQKLIEEQGFSVEDLADGTVRSEEMQKFAINQTIKAREESVAKTLWALGEVKAPQAEMARLSGLSAEEFETQAAALMEVASAAEEFGKKVGEAWASQQDVVAALGENVEATGQDILNWYDTMLADGQKFSENIRVAIEKGYDPALIARIIVAGPEQAGPLLEEMVKNQGDTFVQSVNDAQHALENLNLKASEMARLMNLAVNSGTDQMNKDLKLAMGIATLIMDSGGKTTMDALVKQLKVGADEVIRVADSYGIGLGSALDPIRTATGLAPIPRGRRSSQPYNANAEGGYIDPGVWGDTNADSVPSWLMPGEVVIKKKAVEKWGVDPLLKLNEGEMPFTFAGGGAYAAGGLVAPPNYQPGHFGDTAEQASAQTYMAAVAKMAAMTSLSGGGFGRGGGGGPGGRYTPGMLDARGDILSLFGNMPVGGYANRNIAGTNQRSAHAMWRAWDFMVGLGNVAKGNAISSHLIGHAGEYGLKGLIWNAMSNFGGGWKPYRHPGASGATAQHKDHVHAEFYRQGGLVHKTPWDGGGTAAPGWNAFYNGTGGPETLRPQGPRDVMPQISVNVAVYIGDQQLRGIIRQEVVIEQDKQKRRDRSMANA